MANYLYLNKKNRGFTLTELLIVVSIIVFLVALIIFFLRTQIFKGNDARRKGDMHKIQVAMEEYEKDHDCYPLPPTPITLICNPGTWLEPYLAKVPCDPVTKKPYLIEVEESGCPRWYRLYTILENKVDADIAEVGCTYGCGPDLAYNFYFSSSNAPDPAKGTSSGTPGASEPPALFWGCKNIDEDPELECVRLLLDPERPSPDCQPNCAECDPHWQNSTCYGQCTNPRNECKNWSLLK